MDTNKEKPSFSIQDFKKYEYIWRNNGRDFEDPEKFHSISDAIATPDAPVFLPRVVQNIVKEAAEPLLVGTSLLTRIQGKYGQTITFPAMGALSGVFDMAEGMEYPELYPALGGSTVIASGGKVGCAFKITDEMMMNSQFDIVGMMLRGAGKALARHKEKKIFNLIAAQGTRLFDNLSPTSSFYGVTHGRSMNGEGNGSIVMDDIFDAYAHIVMQGYTPDTLLMHPLTWTMFIKDPVLRYFALAAGGGTFFATPRGNPAGQAPWSSSSQGGQGVASGQNIVPGGNVAGLAASALTAYPQDINSAPQLPSYFGYPFTIIVSPLVNFNPSNKLTDIYIFDRAELGFYVAIEDLTTDEYTDPRFDIRKIKLKERYALAIANEGQGVGVIKNVKVTPNEIILPAQTTISSGVSGSVLPISATENVLD